MIVSEKIYKRIFEKKKKLDSIRPLNNLQLKKLKEEFSVEYVYDSTTMEGNTLTLNETKLVLEEGITIGGKSLKEHLDVTNQKEAFEWVNAFVKKSRRINEVDILILHTITLKGISDYWAGKYKTSQNRITGSKHKPTPAYRVHNEMKNMIYKLNKNLERYNFIELAAFAHYELVRIHPFVDGNGRVARLLCNLILINEGYPPVIIRAIDRKKYYNSLENAHFGDFKTFVDFIGLRIEESLIRYLNSFVKTTKKNELLSLSILAKEIPYSQEYLSLLARRGILPATKINGVWYSDREKLEKYMKEVRKK